MIKKYLFIVLVSLFTSKFAYSADVEIIELHSTKSLDQLVLDVDQDNNKDQIDEQINTDSQNVEIQENESSSELALDNNEINEGDLDSQEIVSILNIWQNVDSISLENNLKNINLIKSEVLRNEFIKLLSDFNLEENNNNAQIKYLIVKKLYDIGEIKKAFNLSKLNKNDDNKIFYTTLELNYLLSTYQLDEVCELKNDLSKGKNKLPNFLLEKIDIFCLIMQDKINEAELLNSLLLETETDIDNYFQNLFMALVDKEKNDESRSFDFSSSNKELIFLYSAMLRIAELPLTEKFLEIDSDNLSIPVILSSSTDMSIRLKAANKSFIKNIIGVDSLSALYQSVDFSGSQLDNSKETINSLKNDKELLMAFFYQLSNVQIFPSERLDVILKFWDYAIENNLQQIAYSLTYNIISAIEPSTENAKYGSEIAISHIYNSDYDSALKWIKFFEGTSSDLKKIQKVKLLLDLNKSDDINILSKYLGDNENDFTKDYSNEIEEIIFVIKKFLNLEDNFEYDLDYNNFYDNRLMPTIFLNSEINKYIEINDSLNLILILIASIDNKEWYELHPMHLEMLLNGLNNYKNSILLKSIIVEILRNYKII